MLKRKVRFELVPAAIAEKVAEKETKQEFASVVAPLPHPRVERARSKKPARLRGAV